MKIGKSYFHLPQIDLEGRIIQSMMAKYLTVNKNR